jgi:cob(I)alamin adenosyltransferase
METTQKTELGMIHFYYGTGTGKTSIVLGRILRSLGHGFKPILIQFLKKHDPSGEIGYYYGEYPVLAEKLGVQILQFGSFQFVKTPAQIEANRALAAEALDHADQILQSGEYDIVVLDELGSMVELGFFDEATVIGLLKQKARDSEVLITGHKPLEGLIEVADYVSHLEAVKHPFQKGVSARLGIEY